MINGVLTTSINISFKTLRCKSLDLEINRFFSPINFSSTFIVTNMAANCKEF